MTKQSTSIEINQTELLRYIIAEGKITLCRHYYRMWRRAELELKRVNKFGPKVEVLTERLRLAIDNYKSLYSMIDNINPETVAIQNSFNVLRPVEMIDERDFKLLSLRMGSNGEEDEVTGEENGEEKSVEKEAS